MSNLDVIIRKDLSMPRGKMGAQAAHSAMKLFIDGLNLTGIPFVGDGGLCDYSHGQEC
jgi:hypothetical protein